MVVITKEMRDNFRHYPVNRDYDEEYQTFDDIMAVSNGNKYVAAIIYEECVNDDWCAYIETYHQENLDYGEYFENEDGTFTLNPEYYSDYEVVFED